jgi:hypothetical protein
LIVVVWLRLPLVPVMATAEELSAAPLAAVKVTTLNDPPPPDAGLNAAVTPLGKLPALNATFPAKLPTCPILMVLTALAPWWTFNCEGLGVKEKSGVITANLMGMAEVMPPPVPVTVTVAAVPAGTVPATLKVIELLTPVTTLGLKVAVTPVGSPPTLRVTGLLKPPEGLISMVLT